jgi:hypothetical protein
MARPPAAELAPVMTEGRPKLTPQARRHAKPVRCPKRHLLAAAVRTPYGIWLMWRGGQAGGSGDLWRCAWADEIADPSAVPVSCKSCLSGHGGMVWMVDFSNPDNPQRRPPPGR